MKKIVLMLFMLFVFLPVSANATSIIEDKYQDKWLDSWVWDLGEATQRGGWVQGMVTTKKAIYYWDGSQMKKGEDGKNKVIFDLKYIAKQLQPYGLDNNSAYFSFIMSDMQLKGNDFYISGLMFRDAQYDKKEFRKRDVVGETYSVLIKVTNGVGTLMHASLSKTHTGYNSTGVYDNATGMPNEAPTSYETRELFNPIVHFDRLTPAKFSFSGNDIIMTRHREKADGTEWADIVQVTGKFKGNILYSFNIDELRDRYYYVYGVKSGNTLTVYDDHGVTTVNLKTKKSSYQKLSDEPYLTRPQQRGSKMFFLNEHGFFELYKDKKGKYHSKFIVKPEYIPGAPHIEITFYDWSTARGGVLYMSDWLRPRKFWSIRPM